MQLPFTQSAGERFSELRRDYKSRRSVAVLDLRNTFVRQMPTVVPGLPTSPQWTLA